MAKIYEIGESASFSKTLTQTDVYNFVGIVGDFNPIHINAVEASKSIFKHQICHGLLTASLISTVIGMQLPGPGSIYLNQDLKFVKPVYFDDTITATVIVTAVDPVRGIITLKTDEHNQEGSLVVTGEAKVKVEAWK